MNPWVPFHYDSNAVFGTMDTPEKYQALILDLMKSRSCDRKTAVREILDSRSATWDHPNTVLEAGGLPSFGYRREHMHGADTLAQWAVKNDMITFLELFE